MRMLYPGVAAHLIQRGVNRAPCFLADVDRLVYLAQLRDLSRKHGCAIHAYCLMTNHVHLLVTPSGETGCTSMMRDLGQRYVPYFNRKHSRTGTLWEGRFRSCLVESARYVLACYRYIELNPVRAGMVSTPGQYAWSSYTTNVGACTDPLVDAHEDFIALGNEEHARRAAYQRLFSHAIDEPMLAALRDSTNTGYPLASEAFKTRVLAPLGWKMAAEKPGPRPNCGPDPELESGVLALTPN